MFLVLEVNSNLQCFVADSTVKDILFDCCCVRGRVHSVSGTEREVWEVERY